MAYKKIKNDKVNWTSMTRLLIFLKLSKSDGNESLVGTISSLFLQMCVFVCLRVCIILTIWKKNTLMPCGT